MENIAEGDHIHLGGHEQNLGEELPDRLQKPPPKGTDRVMVVAESTNPHRSVNKLQTLRRSSYLRIPAISTLTGTKYGALDRIG